MKRMKKPLLVASMVAAVGAAGAIGTSAVHAATSKNSDRDSSLVSAIAKKFNLKESDVQSVIDEQRSQKAAEREKSVKDQITQLVTDGKLTQEQADKINAKRTELQKEREANRTANQNLTDAERKAKMDERKAAIDKWLKDNGIDTTYKYLLGGGNHGGGGRGDKPTTTKTNSDS